MGIGPPGGRAPILARFIPADVIDRELARSRRVREFERRSGWLPALAAAAAFVGLLWWGLPWALVGAGAAGGAALLGVWLRRWALDRGRDLGGK